MKDKSNGEWAGISFGNYAFDIGYFPKMKTAIIIGPLESTRSIYHEFDAESHEDAKKKAAEFLSSKLGASR